MSNASVTATQRPTVEAIDQSTPTAPAIERELVPLPEALRQIQRDAADRPADYLDETTVPRGGE
jgi:hypothetical protein